MSTVESQQLLINELKEIVKDLGEVPTRNLYTVYAKRPYAYQTHFGTWKSFVNAAGLDKELQEKKIDKAEKLSAKSRIKNFYSGDLAEMIKREQAPVETRIGPFPKIVCVPDMHLPFGHKPSIELVYKMIEKLKPDYVIQLGDMYDFYAFSKFPRSHYVISAEDEILTAREQAEEFWRECIKAAPQADHYQILGNHDVRPHRRLLETSCPELEHFFNFKGLFEFDGVTTIHDVREPLVIQPLENGTPISFIHGWMSGNGKHRQKLQSHIVHGHTHSGEIISGKIPGSTETLFELSCGYLGDINTKVFNYTPVKELKWCRGIGFIDTWGPHFIPFE